MTNKQKAIELSIKVMEDGHFESNGVCQRKQIENALMEMAEWKNQQAIEYLYKNIQSLLKDYGVSEESADIATQLFLANFKKAMEE